jgi:hypothetical protein
MVQVFIGLAILFGIALAIILPLVRKMDERDAATLDHYIENPDDAPPGFWDAWDEYMDACYPVGRP